MHMTHIRVSDTDNAQTHATDDARFNQGRFDLMFRYKSSPALRELFTPVNACSSCINVLLACIIYHRM